MKTFLAGFVLEEETQRLLHRPRTGSVRASRGQAAVSVGLSLRVGPHAATLHTDVLAKAVGGSLTNPSWKVIWPKSYFFFFIYLFLISLTSLQKPSGGGDFATLGARCRVSLSSRLTMPAPSL